MPAGTIGVVLVEAKGERLRIEHLLAHVVLDQAVELSRVGGRCQVRLCLRPGCGSALRPTTISPPCAAPRAEAIRPDEDLPRRREGCTRYVSGSGRSLFIATKRIAQDRKGGRHEDHREFAVDRPTAALLLGGILFAAASPPPPALGAGARRRHARSEGGREPGEKATLLALCRPQLPERPYFGDTHLHTSFSMDAGAFGARIGPRDAYRLARGEEITASSGQPVKLSRPLDFLVVADHSDNMGFFPDLFAGKPEMLADPTGRKWYDLIQSGKGGEAAMEIISPSRRESSRRRSCISPARPLTGARGRRRSRPPRSERPGPLHRLHRLRVDVEHRRQQPPPQRDLPRRRRQGEPGRAVHRLPPLGSDNPRDLWKWMPAYEEKTGGDVLAIPHNGNLSNGRMFPLSSRSPARRSIASTPRRARSGSVSTRSRRSRATARPIRSSRPTTSSPTSSSGTRATSTSAAPKTKDDARVRIRALGAQERPQARAGARREPVQVRHGRLDRLAHRARRRRGGQLLRQDHAAGAEPAPR